MGEHEGTGDATEIEPVMLKGSENQYYLVVKRWYGNRLLIIELGRESKLAHDLYRRWEKGIITLENQRGGQDLRIKVCLFGSDSIATLRKTHGDWVSDDIDHLTIIHYQGLVDHLFKTGLEELMPNGRGI